jgi:hypothetical protein
MLGNDLTAIDGTEAGAWIASSLGGKPGAVSEHVPPVFDAYARVFHRAGDSEGKNVTWGEVAKRLGRTAHPEMQWHQLVGSSDPDNFARSKWTGSDPRIGEMEIEELDRLCRVLPGHIADSESCFFGLCVINGWVEDALSSDERSKPQLKLPLGRDHVVFSGPLSAVDQIGAADANRLGLLEFGADSTKAKPEPSPTGRLWRKAPHLIWPTDRSWLVVSEVDFDSTLVGGTTQLVEALVADPSLEVYEVEPNTSLTAFSDKINTVPEVGGRH